MELVTGTVNVPESTDCVDNRRNTQFFCWGRGSLTITFVPLPLRGGRATVRANGGPIVLRNDAAALCAPARLTGARRGPAIGADTGSIVTTRTTRLRETRENDCIG